MTQELTDARAALIMRIVRNVTLDEALALDDATLRVLGDAADLVARLRAEAFWGAADGPAPEAPPAVAETPTEALEALQDAAAGALEEVPGMVTG